MKVGTKTARRIRRAGIAFAILSGVVVGPASALPSSATTVSSTHFAVLVGPGKSLATEHLAGAIFRCDSVAGTWSVRAAGIQVIASDHVTTWDTATSPAPNAYWIRVVINNADVVANIALTQDWSGLYGASGSGTLGANAANDCKAGAPIEVQGGSYSDNLNSLDLVGTDY